MSGGPLIWVDSRVAGYLANEAERTYPLETGGLLLGYRAGPDMVVTKALGSGSRARHRRHWFEPDHEWHAVELRRLFGESEGREYYLGDWHTHPDGALQLSARDRRALKRIISSAEAATSNPVSALIAGAPGAWRLAVWRASLSLRRWCPAGVQLQRLEMHSFGPSQDV
jgi:integrative and conjugative element protein (TIGR02256 family)